MSAWLTAANRLRTTRILSVKTENLTVKTFTFKDRECAGAKPGQFLMLWVPGVDEIPLSIFDAAEDGTVAVAVKKVGEATGALHSMKPGDMVGVRGPFGNSFTLKAGRVLMVGGGTGMVPLTFLVKKLRAQGGDVTFVVGAKTVEELLFLERLYALCGKEKVLAATEDGSFGVKGLATQPAEGLLAKEKFDMVYTCGPERMMREVFELAERYGVCLEASLERLMRCAIGVCGSCGIGGFRVCRDGPVFAGEQLRKVKGEFGFWKRDFDGKRIPTP
ncbi:MAG: dihydroorotate dehydrogenase electron transfer subunit [Nitrososphaerota archaeon]|nr:dihydroorotate dehydrogenase electron transfer subunit [Candidatus Bathyarchaeota archaeon]MDW8022981.1 dihydroorotate dehydrogenase electron transfer subunit [Nitrososphaerota archaeon]